jgi:hypothetical protein
MTQAVKSLRLAPPLKECGSITRSLVLGLKHGKNAAKCGVIVVAAAVLQAISDHLAKRQGLSTTETPLLDVVHEIAASRVPSELVKEARILLQPFHSAFNTAEDLGKSWEALYGVIEGDGGVVHDSNAKRDHGVYYTPKDLANLLTEATLGRVLRGCDSVPDILNLRIVDPAVGAGFFLIAAHRYLLAEMRKYPTGRKLKDLSSRIAQNCLYGVDRDPFAAAVAKVALWLEVGEPHLSLGALTNVRSGDALVSVHGSSPAGLLLLKELKQSGFRPFEWRTAFPEVFGREGKSGFDVVLSNPPWGKIKSDAREFFERLHPEVAAVQGASRKRFIASASVSTSSRANFVHGTETLRKYVELLRNTPMYRPAFGVSTDIDYYTLFVQRSYELVHSSARVGLLIPGAFVRSAGTALIRRQFFEKGETEHLLEFENRERLFPIHGMFKFLLWTFSCGGKPGIRKALFGLRSVNEARTELITERRSIDFSSAFLNRISKEWLSVPELYDPQQKRLFAKLHAVHPPLGEQSKSWNVHFTREMDMTNDSESFIDASTKRADQEQGLLPLYEGRMVHQFDSAAKAYLSGHGRQAKWEAIPFGKKVIQPHYYVCDDALSLRKPRAGFCDITGNSNERTVLAALIPALAVCGNKVPVCEFDSDDLRLHLLWISIANSFVIDWIVRRRISTTLNFFHWKQIPFPRLAPDSDLGRLLWIAAAKLSIVGSPKLQANRAVCQLLTQEGIKPKELSTLERSQVRADIDARVALHFSLGAEEFTYLLSDFGTLDRSQPGSKDRKGQGIEPCAITRDLCLLNSVEQIASSKS